MDGWMDRCRPVGRAGRAVEASCPKSHCTRGRVGKDLETGIQAHPEQRRARMRGCSQGMGVSERQVSPKVRKPDTFQAAPRSFETGKERLRFWVMRPLEAVWVSSMTAPFTTFDETCSFSLSLGSWTSARWPLLGPIWRLRTWRSKSVSRRPATLSYLAWWCRLRGRGSETFRQTSQVTP